MCHSLHMVNIFVRINIITVNVLKLEYKFCIKWVPRDVHKSVYKKINNIKAIIVFLNYKIYSDDELKYCSLCRV
jgi:hypothetical protein